MCIASKPWWEDLGKSRCPKKRRAGFLGPFGDLGTIKSGSFWPDLLFRNPFLNMSKDPKDPTK